MTTTYVQFRRVNVDIHLFPMVLSSAFRDLWQITNNRVEDVLDAPLLLIRNSLIFGGSR